MDIEYLDVLKFHRVTRPLIAPLITTVSKDGTSNVAPMSSLGFASYDPPLLLLAPADGTVTAKNLAQTGELVANIPGKELVDIIHKAAKHYEKKVNKVETLNLKTFKSKKVNPPSLSDAIAWIEAKVVDVHRPKSGKLKGERKIYYLKPVKVGVKSKFVNKNGELNYGKKGFNPLVSYGHLVFALCENTFLPSTLKKTLTAKEYRKYIGH